MDLCSMLRFASGRQGQPSAVVLDGCMLQLSCESRPCNGYDGYKRKRGSKEHMARRTWLPAASACGLQSTLIEPKINLIPATTGYPDVKVNGELGGRKLPIDMPSCARLEATPGCWRWCLALA
jgi:hypothetical protein